MLFHVNHSALVVQPYLVAKAAVLANLDHYCGGLPTPAWYFCGLDHSRSYVHSPAPRGRGFSPASSRISAVDSRVDNSAPHCGQGARRQLFHCVVGSHIPSKPPPCDCGGIVFGLSPATCCCSCCLAMRCPGHISPRRCPPDERVTMKGETHFVGPARNSLSHSTRCQGTFCLLPIPRPCFVAPSPPLGGGWLDEWMFWDGRRVSRPVWSGAFWFDGSGTHENVSI